MITENDVMEFHLPADGDPLWAETNFFGFNIPEEQINVGIYFLSRPTLGVALASVQVIQGFPRHCIEALYYDEHAHLQLPEKNGDYSLANGLSVKAVNPPMDYLLTYKGKNDTEFHVEYEGLMPPYDITDPEMDPNAPKEKPIKGHFDQTGHFKGALKVKGKSYKIDSVSTMDHSWGPRSEADYGSASWFHVSFGRDLTIHCIFAFDPMSPGVLDPFAHGYVLEDGKVYGLKSGKATSTRDGLMQLGLNVEVTDVRGRSYHFTGSAMTGFPWMCWPNTCDFVTLMEWNMGGRIGYGECQDVVSMPNIIRRTA